MTPSQQHRPAHGGYLGQPPKPARAWAHDCQGQGWQILRDRACTRCGAYRGDAPRGQKNN